MRILVCVKQVIDGQAPVVIDETGTWVKHGNISPFRMNRYDEFALEEALRIKEKFNDVTIDAISFGPPRVSSTIRKAMEMGANEGIHILTDEDSFVTPFEVASAIASYAKTNTYEIILTGAMSEDDMNSQVGQLIAELLHRPCATLVMHQEIREGGKEIYVEREIEAGRRECLYLTLPAVLTVQSGINSPRYPSLSNALRARKAQILTIEAKALNIPEKRERLTGLSYPEVSSKGTFIEGTQKEKAKKLLGILHEKSLI